MRCFGTLLAATLAPLLPATAGAQGTSVLVPPSASIDAITGEITLEGWVLIDGPTNHPTVIRRALTTGPSAETVFGLGLPGGTTGVGPVPLGFWVRVGPDATGGFTTFLTLIEVGLPPSFDWHHLAGTFDGVNMRLFWDGVEVASSVHPGGIASSTLPVLLGGGVGNSSWVGKLDEVRLWSVARTPAEIAAFRHAPLVGDEPGLVGYWRLDEGSGQIASDSAENGNDGFLGGLPLPDPADPTWSTASAPLGAYVASATPSFGAFYASTPIVVTGQGFTPGASVLSIGGQPVPGATVVDPGTIQAVVPPGTQGLTELSVSSLYGPAPLLGGWTWADHLHATGGISSTVGGTVDLTLSGEPANAVRLFLVATSLSGTSPGLPLPGTSLVLPLNPDAWTTIGLLLTNTPTFGNFFGVLDGQGTGAAAMNLGPIPVSPAPIGQPIHFAYVVFESFGGGFAFASNAVTVAISP